MTSAVLEEDKIRLTLTKAEALVFFEWVSRNWEKKNWEKEGLFFDPAEKQMLIWLEADLAALLEAPFDARYRELLEKSYREVVPDPLGWD